MTILHCAYTIPMSGSLRKPAETTQESCPEKWQVMRRIAYLDCCLQGKRSCGKEAMPMLSSLRKAAETTQKSCPEKWQVMQRIA